MMGEVTCPLIGRLHVGDVGRRARRVLRLVVCGAMLALGGLTAGCEALWGGLFVPGVYMGDLQCTISASDGSGTQAEEEFVSSLTFTVEADGGLRVNDVELVVGAEVVRSIPTADLAFEVTAFSHSRSGLTVTYEPRPTLPGITVEGTLVETYRRQAASILATGRAELTVRDVDTTTEFTIECAGMLEQM